MENQNNINYTREDLLRMAQTDPLTVDKETLVDIANISIDQNMSKEERVLDFIRQIKNPYCYLDNGIIVKLSFSGKKSLQDCLTENLI